MRIYGRSIREYIGVREVLISVVAFFIFNIVLNFETQISIYTMPSASLSIILGLLFGPAASAGIIAADIAHSIATGGEMAASAMDVATIALASYLPYRLWYGMRMDQDDRPPVLDSVGNTVKFILIIAISSLTFAILYNLQVTVADGFYTLDFASLADFVNIMAFSILIGMTTILIMRYFGVVCSAPKFGGTPEDFRRRIDPTFYYVFLLAALMLPTIVLPTYPDRWHIYFTVVATYGLVMAFMLKPVEHAHMDEKIVRIGGFIRINKFNGSLIERMIAIFLVYGVVICIATMVATSIGMLEDIFNLGNDIITFYMSLGLLAFFIPGMTFLWYLEKSVTDPVGTMASASKNFISDEYGESSAEFERSCKEFIHFDTEIGDLARSLVKMTGDMESYIEDIKSLNSQQEKYRVELNVAKNIQESFIPDDFSSMDGRGVSIGGSMDAARYVGGDFYDFFMIDNDHIGLAIGDVSGKGVPAALFMAVTKSLLESHSHPGLAPNEIMAKVNINLCRNNDENMFVSAWFGILELSTGKLRYSNAGHNPPVLVRAGGEPETIDQPPTLVLGAREGIKYATHDMQLEPGDRILLYTDGATEANDNYRGFYGLNRLMDKMRECEDMEPMDEVSALRLDITEFTNGAEQFDDITLLLFRYDGLKRH